MAREIEKVNKLKGLIRVFKPFNRRRYERFDGNLNLQCKCIYEEPGGKKELSAQISGVSMGGLLIMTGEAKIYTPKELTVIFRLPGHEGEIVVHGSIVRTYRRCSEISHYSGVSVDAEKEPGIKLLLDFARLGQAE